MGGNVDGTMTRDPIGYSAYRKVWQPNVAARIENIGETDVVNPWLVINGIGDWRTTEKIVEEATRGLTSDAERARAIWEWHRKHRFHASTWDREVDDAVKMVNVYGYTLCADDSIVLHQLWKAAGFKTRPGHPAAHATTEVFYDGRWHLMDGDTHLIALKRDNETVAGETDLVHDHDLIKRSHTYSIGQRDDPLRDQSTASLWWHEGKRLEAWPDFTVYPYEGSGAGFRDDEPKHSMHFTLRPGESLEWRWSHVGKEYSAGKVPASGKAVANGEGQLLSGWGPAAYDNLRNGKWMYRPPLDKPVARQGMVSHVNVADAAPDLRAAMPGQTARAVWKIRTPYVLVGGKLDLRFTREDVEALFRVDYSADGQNWTPLYTAADVGAQEQTVLLDELLSPPGRAMYEYFIAVEMKDAALESIEFDNDVQMAPLAMPRLTLGDNDVVYKDETPGNRAVKVTHHWIERTAWVPPEAPAAPLSPSNGAKVEGTKVLFRWTPSESTAGIDYYRIQLSDRPDMLWALSTNFDKVVLTQGEKSTWTVPSPGLLNPGKTYYWRVRAKNSNGVWGPWSSTWSFRCNAPGVPVGLQAVVSSSSVKLTWSENRQGRRAAAFKIYGSDEKGFTASDTEYLVRVGRGFCKNGVCPPAPNTGGFYGDIKVPSNLMGTFSTREAIVVGPGLTSPNANKAYYRVVAVDARGNESGPSDYIAVPRPFIHTTPSRTAAVGAVYSYQPRSTRSIGDLSYRNSIEAFWGREDLTVTLLIGPSWLQVTDGILRGSPDAEDVGRHPVHVVVESDAGGKAEQQFVLEVAN